MGRLIPEPFRTYLVVFAYVAVVSAVTMAFIP